MWKQFQRKRGSGIGFSIREIPKIFGVLSLAVLLTCCQPYEGADGIPVIGLDAKGRPVQVKIPAQVYANRFERVASVYHDSSLEALSRVDAGRRDKARWALHTFAIGVAVSADVGVGPVRIGAVPRFRLIFSNSSDLVYP